MEIKNVIICGLGALGLTYAKAHENAIRDLLGEELSHIIKSEIGFYLRESSCRLSGGFNNRRAPAV